MANLRVTLLGTGSPIPDPNRAGPATLVQTDATNVLVDAGRGVMMRLAGAGVAAPGLDAILLTHLHSDHICGLNDVLTSAWVMSPVPNAVTIYGPPGTQQVMNGLVAMLRLDTGYRLAHHDDLVAPLEIVVHEVQPKGTFTVGDLDVSVGQTDHRPVEPTIGFRLSCDEKSVVIAGDGLPCDSLTDLCMNAHVYVQTVVRADLIRPIAYPRFTDILDYHSTVAHAAQTASRAAVRKLVMTHMVPAVIPGQEAEWIQQATDHFDGEVILGNDLDVITTS